MSKHYVCDVCDSPIHERKDWTNMPWSVSFDSNRLICESWDGIEGRDQMSHACSFACAEKLIEAFVDKEKKRMARNAEGGIVNNGWYEGFPPDRIGHVLEELHKKG